MTHRGEKSEHEVNNSSLECHSRRKGRSPVAGATLFVHLSRLRVAT
jgi:hypothetical protein